MVMYVYRMFVDVKIHQVVVILELQKGMRIRILFVKKMELQIVIFVGLVTI